MKAWVLNGVYDLRTESAPLQFVDVVTPAPGPDELLLEVLCCGVCHTELDEIEGRMSPPSYPIIPGHQVIGRVIGMGPKVSEPPMGSRVGVAWIFSACGRCEYCLSGRENLCAEFQGTGRDANGGYAEFMKVPARYAYPIPQDLTNERAAPLLCAGAIGFRSLRLAGLHDGMTLGLMGFGASGHLVLRMARYTMPRSPIYVFARNAIEREFAMQLGASWSGDIHENPPTPVHSIIDTTPAWFPIVESLKLLGPGGRLVINAIRKESSDQESLLKLRYPEHLWMEKEIKSVANITSQDVRDFLSLAARGQILPEVETYHFSQANEAVRNMKLLPGRGAKVLLIKS